MLTSYSNQSIDLHSKLMDWFLYDRVLRYERVNYRCLTEPYICATVTNTPFSANRGQSRPIFTSVYRFWAHLYWAPKFRRKSQPTKKSLKPSSNSIILANPIIEYPCREFTTPPPPPLLLNTEWGQCKILQCN